LTEDAVKKPCIGCAAARELFREEIAQTVAGPREVDDELKHIFALLST